MSKRKPLKIWLVEAWFRSGWVVAGVYLSEKSARQRTWNLQYDPSRRARLRKNKGVTGKMFKTSVSLFDFGK